MSDDAYPDRGLPDGSREEPAAASTEEGIGSGTGHPDVDEVVAALDGLAQQPLAAQVEVLERAHDRLRAALADVPEAGGSGPSGA